MEELCESIGDGLHSTPTYNDNGGYYFINGNNLIDGKIVVNESTKKVTAEEAAKYNRGTILENSILLSINGTIGSLGLFEGEFIMLGKSACYINPLPQIDRYFLYSYLRSQKIQNYFVSELTGTTIKNLSLRSIRSTRILLPCIEEQIKLSRLIRAADVRIEAQSKIIEELKVQMKHLCRKLLSRELQFKDENGVNFPEWTTREIGQVLTIGSGRDYRHLASGSVPVYGTGGIMTYVNSFLYDGETVCIGRKGTIDKPVYHAGKIWTVDTLFYTHSFIAILPKFVFYTFSMINWTAYNEASGVPSLSKATIEKIIIEVPSLKEQAAIVGVLSIIDSKLVVEENILVKYHLQKKCLLRKVLV